MATSVTLKPNAIDISGSTSGTTTLQASAVAGTTTLTLPAATDTLVGKATTDTLTNKTLTTPSVSSPTISDGTANGVAYLNGSKVLTTGSALTFDGTNLGVNQASPSYKIDAIGSTTNSSGIVTTLRLKNGGTAANDGAKILFTAGTSTDGAGIGSGGQALNSADLRFYTGGSTQAMTLDASGNLGVGTTSPINNSGYGGLSLNGTSGALFSMITNGTESSRIASLGDLTSIQCKASTGYITFVQGVSGGTERARIDSSGNLLVGSTNSNGKLYVENSTVTNTAKLWDTNGSTTSDGVLAVLASRNTTNNTFYAISYYNSGAGAYRFRVADSGNVTNTNNSYGAISDAKLKENIVDATPKLDGLMQVRVVNYNLKTNPEHKQLGVIAQELEQVFPALVDTSADIDEEGNDLGTTTKSVKYSVFVPMLIKAIQEQQAIIQSLTARITALESA